jgi:hypothetical protein
MSVLLCETRKKPARVKWLTKGQQHEKLTPHSKRYIKLSHYAATGLLIHLIHQNCNLFTSCSLRASKNSFSFGTTPYGFSAFRDG